jgi:quinol monooxygenase YgiN
MIAHNVYFSLKDGSREAAQKLVAACKKYLSQHPGTVFFAVGTLAEDFTRPVNDRDIHVGLHLVFEDKAAHDRYQDHPDHHKFIEENKDNWQKVRVFDTQVEGA